MKYRAEIDGLRAVAVLPVILFHGGIELFSGGYVGVDVFFVISGYLITKIILAEVESDRFSILAFYERRARRILPALLVVIAACLPFAWMWMLPHQLKDFFQSILGVGLFSSNILFWREAGYFTAGVEAKPLLHTWSLAVEEQYYVIFPLLLWFPMRKWGRFGTVATIAVISCASLAASQWGSSHAPTANFYLLHSRAWELLVGSLAAFAIEKRYPRVDDVLSLFGLGLIVFAILAYDSNTPFPSLYTVVPVLGTALIILFGRSGTIVSRILSMKLPVAIGLISYSAYLWHQPLFAFARVRSIEAVDAYVMYTLIAAVFLLAYLSWRFVEQPFRRRPVPVLPGRTVFLSASAVVLLILVAGGVFGHLKNGFPSRMPDPVLAVLKKDDADRRGCYNALTAQEIRSGSTCIIGDETATPSVAIIGDSHAAQLTDALSALLAQNGQAGISINGGWCAPLIDFGTDNPRKNPYCRDIITAGFRQILENGDIGTVLMVGQWPNYTLGRRFSDSNPAVYTYGTTKGTSLADNPAQVDKALRATLSALAEAGKRVVLLNTVPEYLFEVPDEVAKTSLHDADLDSLAKPLSDYRERNRAVTEILGAASREFDIIHIDMTDIFCREEVCYPYSQTGFPLYKDSNHVNRTGADKIINAIAAPLTSR